MTPEEGITVTVQGLCKLHSWHF